MLSNNTKAKKIATEAVMKLLVDNGIDVRIISDEEADRLIRHHNDAYKQIVYHGSGQTFDSFDFSHMGEGEGNQTFGWGGYVTEVEEIGKTYAKMNNKSLRRSRIEYEISRLTQSLPFRRGEAKREGEIELRQWKEELAKFDGEDKSLLYTVSIPNDNGKNYLDWTGHPSKDLLDTVAHILLNEGWEQAKSVNGLFRVVKDGNNIVLNERQSGADLYAELSEALGSDKKASKLLYDAGLTGIVYPTNTLSGGNTNGTRNYVIFKEDDMRILDMVQLMRTGDSTIYGFSVGNKIYLTEEGINPETPIHEYTHLWAKAMMLHNKEAWSSVKEKLKTSPVWEEVMSDKSYESIKNNEDEIASEVLSRISGRHNSQYFVQEAEKAQSASNLLDAMLDLWKWVGNTLFDKKNFENIEDITNTVLYDLLNNTDLKLDYAHRQTIHVFSTSNYEDVRPLAHGIKDRDTESINTAARKISDMLIHLGNPDEYVLVPMPSHLGYATYTTDMARIISKRTGIKYMNILSGEPHEPFYDKKLQEGLSSIKPIKFKTNDNIPRDKKIILIDNVLDTGTTAVSASRAFGRELYMAVLGNTANSKQFPYDIDITQGLDSLYNKVYTEEERNIISEAKAAGTYLLAPNGQPTNLTPKQWVQVRTEAFKQWFGDWEKDPTNSSKIVDENQEPLVVFHGSSKDFNEFKRVQGERYHMTFPVNVTSEGFFFTPIRSEAEHYAANAVSVRGGKINVLESFLNIKNPLDLVSTEDYPGEYEKATGWKYNVYMDKQENLWEMMDVEGISDILSSKGYDGVYFAEERDDDYEVTEMSFCALNPTQIKSAKNNIGLFNGDMNDIRLQMTDKDTAYLNAVESGDTETARQMLIEEAVRKRAITIPNTETPAYRIRTTAEPRKTMKVYKTFFVNEGTGRPSSLFISSNYDLPIGVWLDAQDTYHFQAANGKYYTPSIANPQSDSNGKTGTSIRIPDEEVRKELIDRGFIAKDRKAVNVTALAYRPGWHSGDLPFFPQGGKRDLNSKYGNIHRRNQVVFECEIPVDEDYTRTHIVQSGVNKGKTAFDDMQSMPTNGSYKYATNPMTQSNDLGAWYISGSIKINRVLTQEECDKILREHGFDPQEWEQGSLDLDALNYDPALTDEGKKIVYITYDDEGNLIPLSQRFNATINDIRFQKVSFSDVHDNAKPSQVLSDIDRHFAEGIRPVPRPMFQLADQEQNQNDKALRDALIERLRDSGIDVITDVAEGNRILNLANKARKSFISSYDEFQSLRKAAIENNGIVTAGLSSATIKVVDVPRHDFTGSFSEARKQAKNWARKNIVGKEYAFGDNGGTYVISNRSVEKYLSQSAVAKSDNTGVHLAVLKLLPKIISNSIDVEIHPDYKKGIDDLRDSINGIGSEDILVHRAYGAIECEGGTYRVKTTLKEFSDKYDKNVAHSYEIAKIELLEAPSRSDREPLAMTSNNSISAAKLLENVEKSYDKGKLILNESKNSDINFLHGISGTRYQRVFHGSPFDFDKFDISHIGEGAGHQSHGLGFYFTDTKDKARAYSSGGMLYIVNIPDASKDKYLDNDNLIEKSKVEEITSKLYDEIIRKDDDGMYEDSTSKEYLKDELSNAISAETTGGDLYGTISSYLDGEKETVRFLQELGYRGISYKENDMVNYIVFNDEDIDILDKVRLFKTTTGEAYGFTVGGKIYIDPSVATAETPIHEYSHLWVRALQKGNPEEWTNVKSMMKKTPIWKEVKELYPELTEEDEIADEVVATYSGRRGVDRLYSDLAAMSKDGEIRHDQILGVIDRIAEALSRLWAAVADMFHIHYTSPEMVADIIMRDMTRGFDPRKEIIQIDYTREEEEIISEAKAAGTYLLAPNGQPTNLTPKQWVQVRTEAFKQWFGDWGKDPYNSSRIVDANGEPKVMYHGSRTAGFTVFDSEMGDIRSMAPQGSVWFTDTRENAYSYAGTNVSADLRNNPEDESDKIPGIYECFLNIRNPWREDYQGATWQGDLFGKYELIKLDEDNNYVQTYFTHGGEYFKSEEEAREYAEEYKFEHYEIRKDPWIGSNVNVVADEVIDNSYGDDNDGVIIERVIDNGHHSYGDTEGTDYVVWNTKQIKSATQNTGQFMSDEEDIRFQIIGPMGARALDLAMGNDERINAARLAMKMEKQGKDNTTIWRATGWERGTDGIWRYEIPSFRLDPMFDVIKTKTSTRSINSTLEKIIGEGMTLDKIITGENGEQPDLFKAYPSLKDVKIIKDKNRSNSGVAAYNRNSNTIIIRNASSYRSLMWSLTHEIQHVIQNIEGFTGGYSVGKYNLDRMTYLKDNDPMMYSTLHLFGYTSWANLKRCDKKDVIEAVQKYPLMKMSVEEMDQGTKKTYDNIKYFLSRLEVMSLNEWHDLIAAAKKEQISIIRRGNEIYKNIAGEVEAINAEDRMFFKDDEEKVLKMRETPLSETEEIPRAKQITSIPYDGIAALNHKEDNTNTFVMEGNYILSDQERLLVSQITADLQTGRYLLTERSQQYQDVMDEIHICHDKLVSNPQKWITPREKAILSAELEMYHDGAKDLEDYFGIPEYLTTGVLGANNLTAVEMSEFAQKFARHEISFNNEGTLAKNTFMSFLYQTTIDIKNGVNLTERQKDTISEIISNMEVGIYEFSEELGIEVSAINNALAINKTERIDTIDNDDFRNALKEYDFTDEKLYLLANAIDLKYSYTRPENMHNPYLDNNGDFVGDEDFRSFVRNHEQDILDFHREKMAEIHDSIRNSRPLSNAERQIFARDLYSYKNTGYFTNNNISRNDAYSALFGDNFKGNDIYPGTVSGRYMIEAQVLSSTTYALYDISTGKTFYEIDTVALPFLSGIIQENIRNQEIQTGKEPTRIVGSIYSGKPTLSTYTFAESEAIQEEILKETKNIRESYNIQGIIFGEYGGIVNLDELDRSEGQDKDIVLRTRWLVPIENNFTYDNTRVIKKLEDQGFAVTNDFSKNTPTLIPSFVEFDNEDEAKAFVKEVLNLIIDTEKQNNEPFTEEYENYLNWMNGTKDEPMTMENSIVNTIPERVSFDTKGDLEAYITDYCNEHGWDADLNHIDVSRITDMTMLFAWSNFNGDISQWDVSNVTNMDNMFFSSNFNGDISQWDTSNVSNMRGMFSWSKFNGDISDWDVSNVTNMYGMFMNSRFNQPIYNWDVSNVTDMNIMFAHAKFTGDISNWKIQPNTYTEEMFEGTDREGYERELKPPYKPERVSFDTKKALKAYIISYCNEHGWDADLNHIDVSKITDMSELFMDTEFNGDISQWETSNVTNMNSMFAYSDFNGDISQWNVSNVTNMSYLFECSRFNGDISKWDVSNVTNMEGMFTNSNFNGDISDWDVFNVTNMYEMFMNSHFNQQIYNWDVSKVTDMNNMFAYAKFMGDISNWKIQPNTYTEGMFKGTDREGYERELLSSYQEYITFEELSMETLGLSKSQLYLLGKAQQIVSYNNGEIEIPEIKVGFAANPYLSYSGIIYDKFEDFARENKDMLLRYVNYIDSRASAVSREELLPLAEYIQTLKYQLAKNHNNTFNTIDEQDYAQIGEDGRHGLLTTNEDIKLVKGPFYELLPENLKVYVDAYLNMIQQYVPMYPASPTIDIEGENLNAVIYRTCRDNYDKCSEEWIESNDEVTFGNNYQEQEATKYGKYIMTFLKDGQSVHIPQLEDGTISRKGNNLYVTTEDESYRIYPVNGNAEAAIRAGHKFFEQMVTGVITNPERQIILASKDESPLTLNTPDWNGIHSLSIIGKDENGRMFTNEDYYYYDLKGHYIDLSADDYMTLLSAVIHEKDSGEHLYKEREAYSEIMGYLYNPLGLNENNGTTQINVVPLLQFPYISIPYANKMQALGEYQLVYDQDNSKVNVLPTDNFDRHLPEMPLMQVYRKNLNDLQRISKFIMARDVLKSMGSYTQITWDKPVKLAEEYTLYGIKQTSLEQFEVLHETPNGAKIVNLNDIPYSAFINMETAVKNKVQELDNTTIELMPKGCIRIDTVLTERSDDRAIYDIVANGDTIGSFASTNKEEQSIANGEYTATMLAGQKIKMIYRMNNPFEYLMSTDYEQAHTHNYESLNKLHDEIEKYYRYNSISLKEHEAASVNSFKHFGNDFVFNRFASTPIRDEKDMAPIDHYQKALNGLTPYQRMFYYEHYLTSENMPVIDNQENEIRKLYSSILSFGIVNADMLNESEKTIMRTLENIKTEGDLQKWAAEVRYTGTLDFSETTPQDIKENIRVLGNTIYNADDETLRGIYDDCTMERDSNAILRSRAMSVINQYSHQKELHPEDLILFRNGMGFSVFFDDAKDVNEATGWNVTSDTDSGLYLINITTDGYEALAEKDLNLRVVTPAWSIRPIAEMYNNEYISYLQTVDNSLKDLDGVHSTYTNPIEIGDTQITRLYFGQNGIIGEDEVYGGQINIRDIANKSFNFLLIDKIAQGINNGLYNNMGKAENTDIQLSIGESKPVVKDDVSRLVTETLIHSLNKAGIKVNYATQSDIRAAVLDASGNIAFEGKDKKSLMRDGDSMVFGWVSNGEIYLTEEGMNPETPIHEYTHLWAAALEDKNPILWNHIKGLVRETPIWEEVLSDDNYSNIRDEENRIASEVLARISGRENSKKLIDSYGNDVKEPQNIIDRLTEAMEKFWNWVSTTMFGYSNMHSIEEITDRILYDLVGATPLDLADSREFQIQKVNQPERVSFDTKEDLKAYIIGYCNEHGWDADLNHIEVSKITDMSELFMNMDFTGDISKWNTSNVTNMEGMFSWSKFNGDVSGWNVSNVKDMSYMFASSNFNQPIGNWDVSSVIVAKGMFEDSQMNHLPNEWKLSKDADITSMFKGTPLEGREEELQKKTDTPKVSEAQAENTSNNLNSNNMAEETKKTKEPDRSFELTGKELQKYLLSEALERAKTNDGVWFNPKHHGSPTMYPKMDTEINAFNVLMMTLYTDHRGYRTNMFTTFNDAKNNGFGILTGQKSMPYNWYTWDNYVNKFNPNQSISTKEYKALPDEEKVLYKAVPKKDQRAVFNIEQTSMYKAKQEEFKTVVEKDKDSIAHEYYSTLAHKMSYKEAYEELRQRPDRPENEVIVFEKDKFMYLLNEDAGIASKITGLATNDKVARGLGVDNALRVLSKDHAMLFSKLLANNYKVNIQDAPSKIDVSNKANEIINKFKEKSDSFINTVTSQMGVKQVVNPTITTPVSYECDTDRIVSRSMKVTGASQIENINDTYKALVAATGCNERLNRARTFDTDDKYEQLVREVSAAALMSRDGFSGQLSKSNIDNIDYWKREIIEDDHLLDRLERDVNNVIQVIDKLSIGRQIDYVRMRGDKTEAQLDKRYYSVTEALEKMVDADTREVVVITDKANKSAYVILPQGASLEKNNELPGMNKNRFVLALNKQGIEEVKFFNAGGALGIRQPNNFYNDKEITVSKLKQYELNTIKEIDVTEEIARTNKIEIDKVIALKDDNGKWALYVKPTNKPSFTVYPETGDLSLFFKAMKSGDVESFNKIREDIGQKYASLVEARPELKAKILEIDSSDFDLSRISRVSISKDRNNSKVLVIYAEIDGKKMEPRTLDPVQTQRFWLVDDKTGYKVSLAAQLFGPELKVTKAEEAKPYYFNVAYIQDSDSLKSLDELLGKDKKAFISEISNYDQGDGIELNAVTKTTKTSGHSSVVAENDNYVITRDNAAGGDYTVLRKVTEEEVRDAIDRYGLSSDATDDAKSLAYQMTQEKFDNMKAQPIIEMPNGAVLYFQYNKETNNIEVGATTNAGLKVDHTFEYDNSQSLDYNIQGVVEELNEMEEYQEEEQEEEQEETRDRRSGIRL